MNLNFCILCSGLLLIIPHLIHSSLTPTEHQLLDKIKKYYKKEAFPNDNRNHIKGSTLLTVQFFMTFKNMKIINSELHLEVHLWLTWFDERLNLPRNKVRPRLKLPKHYQIWQPQINFLPEFKHKSMNLVVLNNASIEAEIVKTGRIQCSYNPSRFPFETRTCDLQVNTEYGIELDCHLEGTCVRDAEHSQYSHNGIIANWVSSYYNTVDEGPRIEVQFRVNRQAGSYYLMTTFLPSFLLIVMMWLAGFVRRRTVRVIISVSSLTSLIFMWLFNAFPTSQDKMEYNLIDIWLLGCFLLDMLAMFELILVNGALYRSESNCHGGHSPGSSRPVSRHSSMHYVEKKDVLVVDGGSEGGNNVVVNGAHNLHPLLPSATRRKKRFFSFHCLFMTSFPIFVLILTLSYIIAVAAMARDPNTQ